MSATSENDNKIGPVAATFMVAGNMMGSGIFMLPANLAAFGSISILGWIITALGAVALALVFSKLTAIYPAAGGPYAFARRAFGDYMGYQTSTIYWTANIIGNVGLAVVGIGYLSQFVPSLKNPWSAAFAQLFVIWFFSWVNMLGPRLIGRIQSFTTCFALIPTIVVAVFGWLWFKPDMFVSSWNVTGTSDLNALGGTLNFTLWAFVGVESASVSAAVVRDPQRNVPIATICGVVIAAMCYILSCAVLMGMIPNKELVASSAPFALAVQTALGPWAGRLVALCGAIACFGALAGWTLMMGQTAKAAADDGLFNCVFARVNRKNVPSLGLFIVAVLMSCMVLGTVSPEASSQFGKLASVAVVLTLLPYIYSCIAIRIIGHKQMETRQYLRYVIIGFIGSMYCLVALIGSNATYTRWSLIFVIATIVLYSAAITRKYDIEEGRWHVGGIAPQWIRWASLVVTLAVLAIAFFLSVEGSPIPHMRQGAIVDTAVVMLGQNDRSGLDLPGGMGVGREAEQAGAFIDFQSSSAYPFQLR